MQTENLTTNNQNQNFRLLAKVEGLDPRHAHCSFDNYVITPENKRLFEICKNYDGKDSLTLTGRPGTGKSHLATAIMKNWSMVKLETNIIKEIEDRLKRDIENGVIRYTGKGIPIGIEENIKTLESRIYEYRPARTLIVSVVKMFVELNTAAMGDGKAEMLQKYAGNNYDAICFDDLGAEKLTDAKRENLYYIIDERYKNLLPTIVTTNFTIEEISNTEPRIASRLAEMGQILLFNGADYRVKKRAA